MKTESFIGQLLLQKESRNLMGVLAALIVAFVLGRQIAAGSYTFLMLVAGFAVFFLIFFRKESILFLLPFLLLIPNFGLDIPGPWAVTVEDAFILTVFAAHVARSIIQREKILLRKNPLFVPFAFFCAIAAISLFKSVQIGAGSFLHNLKDWMRITELFFLYIVLCSILVSRENAYRMIRNLVFICIPYVIISFYIYATESPIFYDLLTMKPAYLYLLPLKVLRLISIAGSTSQTGMFYATILPLLLFHVDFKQTKARRGFRFFLAAAIIGCIFLTFNRGTWVGILLALFLFLLRGSIDWRKIALATIVVVALSALLVITVFGQSDLEQHAWRALEISKRSGEVRWIRWVSAVNVVLDHPLLGVGYNNYAWLLGTYSIREGHVQQYGSPHNMFVDIITGTGILGFIVFSFLLLRVGNVLRTLTRNRDTRIREIGLGLSFAFMTFIGASMFDSFFYKPHHTGILIVTTWALAIVLARENHFETSAFAAVSEEKSEMENQ